MTIWTAQWHSKNNLDGVTKYILQENFLPVLFKARKEAREYINNKYGYIRERPDLRAQPFGWRVPRAVKVEIEVKK